METNITSLMSNKSSQIAIGRKQPLYKKQYSNMNTTGEGTLGGVVGGEGGGRGGQAVVGKHWGRI